MVPSPTLLTQVVSVPVIETILNLVYFVVGLAVGLFSLWQNQKYFQAQQQDKFSQITTELQQIRDNVASIAHTTSERASSREDRLLTLVTQQRAIQDTQEEAISDIRQVVIQELERSGVSDAVEKTRNLEEKVSRIVTDSTGRVAEISRAANLTSARGAGRNESFEAYLDRIVNEMKTETSKASRELYKRVQERTNQTPDTME